MRSWSAPARTARGSRIASRFWKACSFAPVGFQIYEASGRSILVNQAFIDLFGNEPPPEYNVLRDVDLVVRDGRIIFRAVLQR
jgi:hypothetical protein